MQFVVLECIAGYPPWATTLAFKGGNALRFIYGNRRSTVDLDFTAALRFPDDQESIRIHLDRALSVAHPRFGVKARAQRITRKPADPTKTMPTYDITIAYQLPGDRHFVDFERQEHQIRTIVRVEISLNDVVCETQDRQLSDQVDSVVRVCALEDIIAEKLRALLQQRIRRRHRKQDLYDIARMSMRHASELDLDKIGRYFIRKCEARQIKPRKSAFDDEIRQRAFFQYEHLFTSVDPDYIAPDTAWKQLEKLVEALPIPA